MSLKSSFKLKARFLEDTVMAKRKKFTKTFYCNEFLITSIFPN